MNLSILIPVVLGVAGSWLVNYLSDVLPFTRKISSPLCTTCQVEIPLRQYVLLKPCPDGHSRHWRNYLVMLLIVAGSLYLWLASSERLDIDWMPAVGDYLLAYLLLLYFGVVFVIDMEHRVVMHPVSITGAIYGLLYGSILYGPVKTLIGGAAGFGIMFALYYFGEVFARFMAKRRGEPLDEIALGFGDVNLAGVLGLVLAWPGIWVGLLLAILLGGAVSLFLVLGMLILRRYSAFTAIPYAPFLILAAAYILFW